VKSKFSPYTLFIIAIATAMAAACGGDSPTPTSPNPLPKAQCADGIDNDNDGFIDAPADPDCSSSDDDHEEPWVDPNKSVSITQLPSQCGGKAKFDQNNPQWISATVAYTTNAAVMVRIQILMENGSSPAAFYDPVSVNSGSGSVSARGAIREQVVTTHVMAQLDENGATVFAQSPKYACRIQWVP